MTPRAIAVAQTCPRAGDVQANLEQHLRLTRLAAAAGARVVLFPELSLTGYELGLVGELAFSETDPRLDPLGAAAVSCASVLVVGAPARLGPRLHIGAFILYPDGTTALCTKRRLGAFSSGAQGDGAIPPAEATVFHPGARSPLLRFGDHAAAVAVCADIGDASHAKEAAERGAGAYLASMFVIRSEYEADAARLRAYAARHGMLVALANYGCPSGGLVAAGRSAIWSPSGELVAELAASGPGVAVATETPHGWMSRTFVLDS